MPGLRRTVTVEPSGKLEASPRALAARNRASRSADVDSSRSVAGTARGSPKRGGQCRVPGQRAGFRNVDDYMRASPRASQIDLPHDGRAHGRVQTTPSLSATSVE
jgi:hypothetical protein